MEGSTCTVKPNPIEVFIEYKDASGTSRTKSTKRFNHQTKLSDIKKWIWSWRKVNSEYDLVIRDQHNRYVDFDDGYIEEYKPFDTAESPPPALELIELRIIEEKKNCPKAPVDTPEKSLTGTAPVVTNTQLQSELVSTANQFNPEHVGNHFLQAPHPITIGEEEPSIGFTKNVNGFQRDQYKTDNPGKNGKSSCYVQLQADKTSLEGDKKKGSVPPKLKILKDILRAEMHLWELHAFLVHEVCENGTRTLYHNEERQFLGEPKSQGSRDQFRPEPVICQPNHQMFEEDGSKPQTKTDPTKNRHLFCNLTNTYSAQTIYETTRLACLLVKDGIVEWKSLKLSSPMTFTKAGENTGYIPARNANGELVEQIPVRTLKRKRDLNQSDAVVRHPPRATATQKKAKKTDASSSLPTQNCVSQPYPYMPNQILDDYSTSHNEYSNEQTQLQYSNPQNCYLEYPQHNYSQQILMGDFPGQQSIPATNINDNGLTNNAPYQPPLPRIDSFQNTTYSETWSQANVTQPPNSANLYGDEQTEDPSESYLSAENASELYDQLFEDISPMPYLSSDINEYPVDN